MATLLTFEFLAIFNLIVIVLWPARDLYAGARTSALSIVMAILTIIAVVLDILFLGNRLIHG